MRSVTPTHLTAFALLLALAAALAVALPVGAQDEAPAPSTQLRDETWLTLVTNTFADRDDELADWRGERCAERVSRSRFRTRVGKGTRSCSWRTVVLGRDLEVAATVAASSTTPRSIARRTSLGVVARGSDGSELRFSVIPKRRRWILSRVDSERQTTETVLGAGRNSKVRGTGKRTRIRLRVRGNQVSAEVRGEVVVALSDEKVGSLDGRTTGIGVFSDRIANRARGIFDSITIQVPDPG